MQYRFENPEEADPEERPAPRGKLNEAQFNARQALEADFPPLTPEAQQEQGRRRVARSLPKSPQRINEHYHVGIVDQQSKDNYELGDGHSPFNFEHIVPVDVNEARQSFPRASEEMAVKIAHAVAQSKARQILEKHFQTLTPISETVWGTGAGGMSVPKGRISKGASGDLEAYITHRYQSEGDPKHQEEPGSFYQEYNSPGYVVTKGGATQVTPVVGKYARSTRKDGNKTMRVGEAPRQPGQINVGGSPYR